MLPRLRHSRRRKPAGSPRLVLVVDHLGRPAVDQHDRHDDQHRTATGRDRGKTSSKHQLICVGKSTPIKVITIAANVNDVTQPLTLVDGIPPVAGRASRPRCRPDAVPGDKGYNSSPNRREMRKRRILPVLSSKGAPNIKAPGKLRYVVESRFALLHHFQRLAVRVERRLDLHDALVSLVCGFTCWRCLKKARS